MYWADPETGCSPNFWLRAMGWFLVAMVDVLERMDEQLYNEYRGIMAMLKQTVEDMHKFQDEQSGMFWQVIDHPEAEGNYLETSGTALFAYAVLKGVRLGYLPKRMAAWAEKAFYGTCDRYLSKNPDGSLQLDGICLLLQRAGSLQRRQGRRSAGAGLYRDDRTEVSRITTVPKYKGAAVKYSVPHR